MNQALMGQIDRIFARYGDATAGCAVGVIQSGETVAAGAYGKADLERGVPNTTSTLFNLGSMSKQFTAFAVLLLEADGLLSLHDEARTHLPEFHDFGIPITLRHLMHHTSGLRDTYPDLLLLGGWRFTDHISQDDCLKLIFDQRELSFEPGSEHLYANANYVLLAEIVARVSGMSLGEFCRRQIFEPLGMGRTLVMDDTSAIVPGRALGYYEDGGAWFNLPLTDTTLGSTNVYSTVEDLAHWLRNLSTGAVGGPVVMERMVEPGRLSDGTEIGYAGGLQVGTGSSYRGHRVVEHGGQHGGYCSWMYWFPEDDLALVVLFNHFLGDTREQLLRVADLLLDGRAAEPPPVPIRKRRVEIAPDELQALTGVFFDASRRVVREVALADGTLTYLDMPLIPVGPRSFVFDDEPSTSVVFDDQGLVLATSDGDYTYGRVEPTQPGSRDLEALAGRYESPEMQVAWTIESEDNRLRIRRHKYVDTFPVPLFHDTFSDDWTPILAFPMNFVIEFQRDASGAVAGLRVSGGGARGLWFGRVG